MVEIKFSGRCENCVRANLELNCVKTERFFGDYGNVWSIKCKHEDICQMWSERLENAAKSSSAKMVENTEDADESESEG